MTTVPVLFSIFKVKIHIIFYKNLLWHIFFYILESFGIFFDKTITYCYSGYYISSWSFHTSHLKFRPPCHISVCMAFIALLFFFGERSSFLFSPDVKSVEHFS